MGLAGPLRMQTGLNAHVVGAAAVWSFDQHGIVVYERE
jgi:hypothetical protein